MERADKSRAPPKRGSDCRRSRLLLVLRAGVATLLGRLTLTWILSLLPRLVLTRGLVLLAGLLVLTPALAADEFYVVRDSTTKKCMIVDKKPTTSGVWETSMKLRLGVLRRVRAQIIEASHPY